MKLITKIDIPQNVTSMNDTNRILFCSGMFSFDNTNSFTEKVADKIRAAFEAYANAAEEKENTAMASSFSEADEEAPESEGEYSADMFNETNGQEEAMGGEVVINNGEITAVENGDWVALFGLIGS